MFQPLISPNQAAEIIFSSIPQSSVEHVSIHQAMGRICAEELLLTRDMPPFDRAMMDGYGFTHLPKKNLGYPLGTAIVAGSLSQVNDEYECYEIMTGAMIPPEIKWIIPHEWTEVTAEGLVNLKQISERNQFIHKRGSDGVKDEVLIEKGSIIGLVEIALCASHGFRKIPVFCKPRISLITTGDEVITESGELLPWQILGSHAPMIMALLHNGGFAEPKHFHARDEREHLASCLAAAADHSDIIIITGGISKGGKDHVKEIVSCAYGSPAFHGIAQKPGKPMAYWATNSMIFALPGNPLSVLTCLARYVIPALTHYSAKPHSFKKITLITPPKPLENLAHFLPINISNMTPQTFSNSGNLLAARYATGIIEVPPMATATTLYDYYPFHINTL